MKTIFLTSAIWLLATAAWGADLTPSVRYFNFDYNSSALPDSLDSIYGGRYDVLVSDGGASAATKYTELYAFDNTMQFYQYVDLHNAWESQSNVGQINDRMAGGLADSTSLYWHSQDSAVWDSTSGEVHTAVWMVPYSVSEPGSRLVAYEGARRLINITSSDFAPVFCDSFLDSLQDILTGWPVLTGIWGDNMTIPQVVELKKVYWDGDVPFFDTADCTGPCDSTQDCEDVRGRMHEDNLGNDTLFGCEIWSGWQQNYRDTQLVTWLGVLGDSMATRNGLELCVNGNGWAGFALNTSSYGYHADFDDTTKCGKVSREHEYGGRVYLAGEFFYPGPTNGATSIDTGNIGSTYDPVSFYDVFVGLSTFGEEKWFNPRDLAANRRWGWTQAWYDALAQYYLMRSNSIFLSFSVGPSQGSMNWLTGDLESACDTAGFDNDSCYWIGALGERLGRDDNTGWDSDTVNFYAASVTCADCIVTTGVGKDDLSQNYVVYSRQWSGDDNYTYFVAHRPAGNNQWQFVSGSDSSYAPAFSLPSGNWNKLAIDGSWGANITQDSLRNGEGGIYRQLVVMGTKLRAGHYREVKIGD